MIWLNSPFLLILLVSFPFLLALQRNNRRLINLLTAGNALILFLVQLIKQITAIPRPYQIEPNILGVKTNIPNDYSFPSLHAGLATFFAWAMSYISPKLSWLWFGILAIIAYSRIRFGLHYPRDIIAGFGLATLIFWSLIFLTQHRQQFSAFTQANVRRKIFHLFYGLSLVALMTTQIPMQWVFIFFLIIIYSIIILFPILPHKLQILINYFERPGKRQLWGVFFFTLSAFTAYLLFPFHIASAAILYLAVGDSVNALVGAFFHLPPQQKRLEATLAATGASFLITLPYLSPQAALLGSLITALFEFSEPKIKGHKINDNVLIPIASGLVVFLARI